MSETPRPWPILARRVDFSTRIFQVTTQTARNPRNGRERDFVVLDSPDWVNVVALTPRQEVVLIRQYRFGTGEVALEIPGGLIDPGDTPQGAAVRELMEETGYAPGRVSLLGRLRPNPAFLNNTLYTYLVEDAVRAGEPRLDPGEDIGVELFPAADIPGLVASGRINHALVLNALFWWRCPEFRTAAEG